jgi:2,3-bisphosphoglycerate-dependent phosphoglycerate mutase
MFTPPPPPQYTIILLRHGESIGNAEGRHQGQSDFPLTERGRQQAQALAARWQREKRAFDRVITSPLTRAHQTAEIVAAALQAPIEMDPAWLERDVGLLSGQRPEEALRQHPRPAFIHPYQPIGETGEGQWALFLRAGHAIQTLMRRPPGRYLIVSHGGILNMALYAILGLTPHANFTGPRFRFNNTSFATLTYTPEQHAWRVLGLNDRQHWQAPDDE